MKNHYEIINSNTPIVLEDENNLKYEVIYDKPVVVIYANGNHHKNWKIIIDLDDLDKVNDAVSGRWYVNVSKGTIYAHFCKANNKKRTYLSMHRLITDCPTELVPDHHPHHYGLDNRKANLTLTTISQNCANQHKASVKIKNYNKK